MQRGLIASAFLATTLVAASVHGASPTGPAVGKLMTFKDWTVGCDNGLACQAVALMPEGGADRPLSVVVKRAAGVASPLTIELAGAQSKAESYRILVDGKIAMSGAIKRDSDFIMLGGADAVKLARAMTKGRTVQLLDGTGTNLGATSLSGASAALRYIDGEQGRAGSTGAIVAIGKKKEAVRKASVPVITAKKIAPSTELPDASALVALSESSPCVTDRFGSTEDTAYSLGGEQALVLINCGAGAYNVSTGIYVGIRDAKGKWTFAPAKFDYAAAGFSEGSAIPILVNSDWDPATQSIVSYAKGRGLGDCGASESYVWDGSMFRMTDASRMDGCRGSVDWIPIWRAEVKLVP